MKAIVRGLRSCGRVVEHGTREPSHAKIANLFVSIPQGVTGRNESSRRSTSRHVLFFFNQFTVRTEKQGLAYCQTLDWMPGTLS